MDRASLYFRGKDDKSTFSYDDDLPLLPLPELRDTMSRYYDSLKPFGSDEELANSRRIIEQFEQGVGAELQAKLKERATNTKYWLGSYWEDYGYHLLRLPLLPYQLMLMPSQMVQVGVPETSAYMMKSLARHIYHTLEFWDIIRHEALKPLSSNGGKIKYNSGLYKQFLSTSRVPGLEQDHVEKHFRTKSEGSTPTHVTVSGKGRQFAFNGVHEDDTILTAPEILVILQRLRSILDYEPMGDGVPALTNDDRTSWAKNRNRIIEISEANKETLRLVESSCFDVCWDENMPQDTEQSSQMALYGDYHSRWADRSSCLLMFKNGYLVFGGEHSCYDGTFSASFATFIQLSFFEVPEPDWNEAISSKVVDIQELKFELDDKLRSEIKRVLQEVEQRGADIIATFEVFDEYGKDFMKTQKLHPDSFMQVLMQWAYYQMHNEIAPTYETALMRHFYNGRTETLRSCTNAVHDFLKASSDSSTTDQQLVKAFRTAVKDHRHHMDEARKGHGVDRHLFGLWCAAYESNMEIPALYDDPLYAMSGGGGNFVISSSTLGFTPNVGFVAPMTLDGYGVFYGITSNAIYVNSTCYRDSIKTSARKYNIVFRELFCRIQKLLEQQDEKSNL
ncbi:peroxisomal carnitine O-octanoyltransferase [Drosophila grimshawi]|uniref:GH16973 n=1 Tax=Drosophila grimshawi TaxID=7222 RepID=B4JU58_DROGR|nr:peroxisomal carnitine O-octanoyltransferase [Drosophila grimshawi]XP_032596448.1 peroxisomal carnitine O-octanoyltransferase [Drosophila grimshawi]EDV91028.1 GH16973 [Drosophila grimshawi]